MEPDRRGGQGGRPAAGAVSGMKTSRWGAAVPVPEEQQLAKRRALIREAGAAFGRLGYHKASLDDVAKALHVTKTALYYYVKDKNEILFECFNLTLDVGDRALREAEAGHERALDRIRAFVIRYILLTDSELGGFTIVSEPLTSLQPAEREKIRKRMRAFDTKLRKWVGQAIAEGDIADESPALVVAFLMGAVIHIKKWYEPDGPLPIDEIAQRFARLITAGLCGGKT